MKNIYPILTKSLVAIMFVSVAVVSTPNAEAYVVSPYQYQFDTNQYQYQVYSAPVQTQYYGPTLQQLLQQIAQLQQLLLQLQGGSVVDFDYDYDFDSNDDSEIELKTKSATDIRDDSARLRGEVEDFNRSDYADVWFEYGTSKNSLNKRTPITRIDEDENESFSTRIAGLRDYTRYYFRAVGEDDDEEKTYGSTLEFRTSDDDDDDDDDDRYDNDEPDVSTRNAFDIERNRARLEGEVDMNDFKNGEVFFIYGEDEDQIDDVEDDYDSYSDVDEDGDDLRKFRVDSDLDSYSSYEVRIGGLDNNTDYYFALCVGYEDEDDDEVLKCSSTRDFTTD